MNNKDQETLVSGLLDTTNLEHRAIKIKRKAHKEFYISNKPRFTMVLIITLIVMYYFSLMF